MSNPQLLLQLRVHEGSRCAHRAETMARNLGRIFDDIPTVGCEDWSLQSLTRPSGHAVCRGYQELMTLEKGRL